MILNKIFFYNDSENHLYIMQILDDYLLDIFTEIL